MLWVFDIAMREKYKGSRVLEKISVINNSGTMTL